MPEPDLSQPAQPTFADLEIVERPTGSAARKAKPQPTRKSSQPTFADLEVVDPPSPILQRNRPFAKPGPYITTLNPEEQRQFRAWVTANRIPYDPSPYADYDMPGYWKALQLGLVPPRDPKTGHFTDTFKTPYHESFSALSRYATPNNPFKWHVDTLIDTRSGQAVFSPPPPAERLRALLAPPGPYKPIPQSERIHAAEYRKMEALDPTLEPRAILGGAAFGLGGEGLAEETGGRIERGLLGTRLAGTRAGREAAHLIGSAVATALTPFPMGTGVSGLLGARAIAERAVSGVTGTSGADVAGLMTKNEVVRFVAGMVAQLLTGHLLGRIGRPAEGVKPTAPEIPAKTPPGVPPGAPPGAPPAPSLPSEAAEVPVPEFPPREAPPVEKKVAGPRVLTPKEIVEPEAPAVETEPAKAADVAKLSPYLQAQIGKGKLTEEQGAVIGRELGGEEAAQGALYEAIRGKGYTAEQVTDFIRLSKAAEATPEEGGLFSKDFLTRTAVRQQTKILSAIRKQLVRVSKPEVKIPEVLREAPPKGLERLVSAREQAAALSKFAHQPGTETNNQLTLLARELAKEPKRSAEILRTAKKEIPEAVKRDLQRAGTTVPAEQGAPPVQPIAAQEPMAQPPTGAAAVVPAAGAPRGPAIQHAALPGAPPPRVPAVQMGGGAAPVGGPGPMGEITSAGGSGVGGFLPPGEIGPPPSSAPPAKSFMGTFFPTVERRAKQLLQFSLTDAHLQAAQAKLSMANLRAQFAELPDGGIGVRDAFEARAWDLIPKDMRLDLETYAKLTDDAHRQMGDVLGREPGYIENWIGHLYKGDPADNARKVADWARRSRNFVGKAGFLKQRKIPTYADAAEMGLEPLYDDVADQMLAPLVNEYRYIGAMKAIRAMIEEGFLSERKVTDRLGPGEEWLRNGRGNPLHIPAHARLAGMEHSALAGIESAVNIFNNFMSPGFMEAWGRKGPRWRVAAEVLNDLYMIPANAINATHVAFSGFHFTFINVAATSMKMGGTAIRGLGKALIGDFRGAAADLKRLPNTMSLGMEDYFRGSRALEAFGGLRTYPGLPEAVEAWARTGARLERPTLFGKGLTAMRRAQAALRPIDVTPLRTAFANAFRDIAHGGIRRRYEGFQDLNRLLVRGWIMDYFVHRAKLGAAIRLYHEAAAEAFREGRLWEPDEALMKGHDIMTHLDDVMGQVPREHLYFNNGVKDFLHVLFAFPGWQLGSARLGAKAASGFAKNVIRGFGKLSGVDAGVPRLTYNERLAVETFGGMLVVHAMTTALMNRLLAGEWPQTPMDYIAARTGKNDQNGRPLRVWAPDYFRTYYTAAEHPIQAVTGRLNPMVSEFFGLLTNRDYWGDYQWDPNANTWVKTQQAAKSVMSSLPPFAAQARQRLKAAGIPALPAAALAYTGFTPPPAWVTDTPLKTWLRNAQPHVAQTPEQRAISRLRYALGEAMRQGDNAKVEDLVKQIRQAVPGGRAQAEISNAMKRSQVSGLAGRLRGLPLHLIADAVPVARSGGDREDIEVLAQELRRRAASGALVRELRRLSPEQIGIIVDFLRSNAPAAARAGR